VQEVIALKGTPGRRAVRGTRNDAALAAEELLRAPMKPQRERATHNDETHMVTSSTWEGRGLSQNEQCAGLRIDIMPDHFCARISPPASLEKAGQFLKGGFSYRAKKDLGSNTEAWQKGFQDHRVRDASDWVVHVSHVHDNPVKEHFCEGPDEFLYSCAHAGLEPHAIPPG
jgi:putative transposase